MLAEYNAVKAQIEADPLLAGKVTDSAKIDSQNGLVREQYVILFGGPPITLGDERYTAPQLQDSDAVYSYTVRAVSVTAAGAMLVASKVAAQLIGAVVTVPGRKCERIRLDEADSEVTPDMTVKPPLYALDQDFILVSRRGA